MRRFSWNKITALTTMTSGLLIPVAIFIVGTLFTKQQRDAEAAQLNQQKEADAAQRNADRIAVLLTHLASDNRKERLLAIRFVDYLIQNKLFPQELSEQDLLLDAVDDEDKAVAHAASHALTQAVNSDPALKQSVEEAAKTNPKTKRTVIKAAELSPELKSYVNVEGIRVRSPVPPGSSDTPPIGATARCKDGTYSFSRNRKGTCSHHRGVSEWL